MQIIEYDFTNNSHAQNSRILSQKELIINPRQGCICILSRTDFEILRSVKTALNFLDCGSKNPKLELYRALLLHTRQKGKARFIRLPLRSVSRLKVSLSGLLRRYDRSCPFCLIVVNDQVFKEYIQSLEHKRQNTEVTFSGKTNLKSLLIHKYKHDPKIKSLDREYLGVSVDTQYVRALICQASQTQSPVLIQGETGVGKDVVARLINKHAHYYREGIFQINCASLPETLFESELFGYEKGAFTGAATTKKGLFAEANHCTLFLDEIGELSPTNQAKLLVVLETGEIRPVGGNKNIKVDVRLIAATNRNLEAMIQQGTFREDLFYRLNGTRIIISPLRKRPDDIEPIANHIWKKLNGKNNLSKAFIKGLQKQTWPGNVRELKATLNSIMDFFGTGDAKPHYINVLQNQKLEDVKLLSEYKKDEKTDFLKAESQRRMIEIQILINQVRIVCTNHSEADRQSAAYQIKKINKHLEEYLQEPVYFRNNDLLERITSYTNHLPAVNKLIATNHTKTQEFWKNNLEMLHTKTNTLLYELIWENDN